MKKALIILFLFHFCHVNGQQMNRRLILKNGIGLKIGGPTPLLDVNFNHFINHNLNLEFGLGLVGGYAGAKYYAGKANKKTAFSPFFGVEMAISPWVADTFLPQYYFPLGIQFLSKHGFNFSLECSWYSALMDSRNNGFYGAMNVAYQF